MAFPTDARSMALVMRETRRCSSTSPQMMGTFTSIRSTFGLVASANWSGCDLLLFVAARLFLLVTILTVYLFAL